MAPPLGPLLNVMGGVVLACFGLLVAYVGRGRAAAYGVAVFSVGFGAVGVSQHLPRIAPSLRETLAWFSAAAGVVATVGLLTLLLAFPARRRWTDRSVLGALALMSVIMASAIPSALTGDGRTPGEWARLAGTFPMFAAYGALLLVLALDAREPHKRSGPVIATVGLVPYLALHAAVWSMDDVQLAAGTFGMGIATYLILIVICAVWLSGARGGASKEARNIALFVLVVPLIAALMEVAGSSRNLAFATRVWAVVVLAYGILRHQLLGIAVKLRWTISKSTIAAIFVAVFFIASEVAQQFFGDTLGSTYIGIAAAGALVFAMAPLQRVAERLAEKAVPVTHSVIPGGKAEAFRRALRLAAKDRRFTPEEEIELAHIAHELGLTGPDAARLRHEVEQEARA